MGLAGIPTDHRTGALYGGQWIKVGSTGCSAGYANLTYGTTTTRYAITAGHCGADQTTVIQGLGGTRTPGKIAGRTYAVNGTGNCDCAPIGPLPIDFKTSQVRVNSGALYTYTKTGSVKVGDKICHDGAASYDATGGIVCGTVTSASIPVKINSFNLTDAFESDADSRPGDSGAPNGNGPSFLGIVSGGIPDPQTKISRVTFVSKSTNFGTAKMKINY